MARKQERPKKNRTIDSKYVWQHANGTTSAFCIVVDNRYSIPLPKRIQNALSYGIIRSKRLSVSLYFHSLEMQKDAMQRDQTRFSFNKNRCARTFFSLRLQFLRREGYGTIVGQFPNKMHFISDILSKCYNNNFNDDILVRCTH